MDGGLNLRQGMDEGLNLRPGKDGGLNLTQGMDAGLNLRPGKDGGLNLRQGMDEGLNLRPGKDGGLNLRPGKDGGLNLRQGMDLKPPHENPVLWITLLGYLWVFFIEKNYFLKLALILNTNFIRISFYLAALFISLGSCMYTQILNIS